MTETFMLMYKDPRRLQVVVHSIPSFPLAELVGIVLLPDGLAHTATSPNEAQACRNLDSYGQGQNFARHSC